MKKRNKKRMPLAAWIGFSLAAVLLVFNGYTFAKFVSQREQQPVVTAKNFYFESDLLSKDGKNKYTLKTGQNDITFSLMNYPDTLRVAEVDIDYEIFVDNQEVTNYTATATKGKLGMTQKKVDIILPDLSAGTYKVEAKATEPYVKSLSAEFTIVAENSGIQYTVGDSAGTPTLLLTVTTTDYEGDVTINWHEDILPDNTDPLMASATGTSKTVAFKKNSQYTFWFFKTNPTSTYTANLNNKTITIS